MPNRKEGRLHVSELAECRMPRRTVSRGFYTRKDKKVENGRVIFDEIIAGDIRSADLTSMAVGTLLQLAQVVRGLFDATRTAATRMRSRSASSSRLYRQCFRQANGRTGAENAQLRARHQ